MGKKVNDGEVAKASLVEMVLEKGGWWIWLMLRQVGDVGGGDCWRYLMLGTGGDGSDDCGDGDRRLMGRSDVGCGGCLRNVGSRR